MQLIKFLLREFHLSIIFFSNVIMSLAVVGS